MSPPSNTSGQMAARWLQKPKGTKIESIAAGERAIQDVEQLAEHWKGRRRELQVDGIDLQSQTKVELETALKAELEEIRRIRSEKDTKGVVSKEICAMWQNTCAKDVSYPCVLVPCSQDTIVVSSAAASRSGLINKRDELQKNLEDSRARCAYLESVIEQLEKTNSGHLEALQTERDRFESLREANKRLRDRERSNAELIEKMGDDMALERVDRASLETRYLKLQESHSDQTEKMEALHGEQDRGRKIISGLEEQLGRFKIEHGRLRILSDRLETLTTLTDKQGREMASKDSELEEIGLSRDGLKVTVSQKENELTALREDLNRLTRDHDHLVETETRQSRLVETLRSQLEASNKEATREKRASAKALEDVLLNCRIADSETNDRLSRTESAFRVSKSRMHEGHRRSQQYLRNTIHRLEMAVLTKETMINVFVDLMEQAKVLHDQKEEGLRQQIDSRTKSRQTLEARTDAEKRWMREKIERLERQLREQADNNRLQIESQRTEKQLMGDEIATLNYQLQEEADDHQHQIEQLHQQADRHRTRIQELENDLEASREENEQTRVALRRSDEASAMHLQIVRDIYGNGLCEEALASFGIRTRPLETELSGPSELQVDFQNSRFHGYGSFGDLTAEVVARKVLRFLWLLENETARRCVDEYTDMVDIWRAWEDPGSMGLDQKASIFYILFDFSLHVITTARFRREVSPFVRWLALELLNALIRYGATEAHLEQVNHRILRGDLGPQAQIVNLGDMHPRQEVVLGPSNPGQNFPPLLMAPKPADESETKMLTCVAASGTVQWRVSYTELGESVHMVSKAIDGAGPVLVHHGVVDRYRLFRERFEVWLTINGGEDFWRVTERDEGFRSWLLVRATVKPCEFDEWRRNVMFSD